ncbi:inner nuclear membrane protein enriched at telomere/subtelomere region [Mortierella alpina]|nr:inner nuclear membrane protein enriched at telomere/subtelomere region [Mortierella alpina]
MPPIKVPRYLQPDFDPLKIKMDTIREILISHNIKAPTGAVKKQELIDLFEQHIRPQAPALRRYYETIVPSEEGIIKVPRSSTTTLAFGHSDSEATSSQANTEKTVRVAPKRCSTDRNHRSSDLTPLQSSQSSQSNTVEKQPERNMTPSGKTAASMKAQRTNNSIKDVRRPDETTPRGKEQVHSLINRRPNTKGASREFFKRKPVPEWRGIRSTEEKIKVARERIFRIIAQRIQKQELAQETTRPVSGPQLGSGAQRPL